MRRAKMLPAVEVLQKGGSFALIAHIAPDGDTIGSCLALAHLLIEQGKSVELYCHDRPPESLKFLDGIQYFKKPDVFNGVGLNNYEKGYTHYDAVICLDCSDAGRLGDAVALFNHTACTVNIDHHATNTMYASINIVEPRASSTAELIFDLIKAMNKNSFSVCICEALYTGIVTDTGGFGFSNTTPAAHRIAAEASITSDSVMVPTPLWMVLILTLSVERRSSACLTASADPCTSALMIMFSSFNSPCSI